MEILGANPGRKVAIYFLATIACGTILLALPLSTVNGSIHIADAIFTATSAVCVTGLTVLDTGKDFTLFGQVIILLLIQLGGLGIMTFATATLLSLGSRLSFGDRLGLSESLASGVKGAGGSLLKAVFITAFLVELLGAIALFVTFRTEFPLPEAIFVSVFHSISAFCNAGFSTFSDSLMRYSSNPYIITVFTLLIVAGGLGFVVVREVYERLRYRKQPLSLHSKLCLAASLSLLLLGAVAILIAERDGALMGKGLIFGISNAIFQSATSRTAGFNTVLQSSLTDVGVLVTMLLMFIGGCPGSTAGGIKTTTAAIILLLVFNRFRGREHATIFKRTVSSDSVIRAVSVVLLAFLVVVVLFALLMFIEEKPLPHKLSFGWFVDLLFETISAFGTVGLSLGVTAQLHDLGKIILAVLMFTGRVGPLALVLAMARPVKHGEIVFVDEEVMVG